MRTRFSDVVAVKPGRTWKHLLFGYDAMIGSEMRVDDQINAIQTCNDMNSQEDRIRIQSQLIAREKALIDVRNRNPDFTESFECPTSSDHEIAKIYAEYPVEGFHLGGVEKWMCILADLGSTDFETGDKFIQQFWVGSRCSWAASLIESGACSIYARSVSSEHRKCMMAQCFFRAPHDD